MKREDINAVAKAWNNVQEAAYGKKNEELKGNQHKIDHNKDGKISAADFKGLRSKAKKGQETEVQTSEAKLDELSKKTLGSYIKKASYDAASNAAKFGAGETDKKGGSSFVKSHNRLRGITKATDKLTKEEVEQIDELKKSTLASYVKKASGNMAGKTAVQVAKVSSSNGKADPDLKRGLVNRMKGIGRAADKLAKEEVEQVDEQRVMWATDIDSNQTKSFVNAALAKGFKAKVNRAGGATEIILLGDKTEITSFLKSKKFSKNDIESNFMSDKDAAKWFGHAGVKEEVELEESITKMSHSRLKWHMNTGVPHGRYSKDEMKAERDRRMKTGEGEAYKKAKPSMSEEWKQDSGWKKPETHKDKYGNTIKTKNVAKSLAKDAAKKSAEDVKEAATHKPGVASPRGEGLSPNAKKELARTTPISDFVNEPVIDKKTFDAIRSSAKNAKARPNDNMKGDKNIINKPNDITARASKKEDDGFKE